MIKANFMHLNNQIILFGISSFILSFLLFPSFIKYLNKKTYIQYVSDYAPENHKKKQNIPNMGGFLILFNIILMSFIIFRNEFFYGLLVLITLGSFGTIGFLDDLSKARYKDNKGIAPINKLKLQFLFSLCIGFLITQHHDYLLVNEGILASYSFLKIPFLDWNLLNWQNLSFELKCFGFLIRISIIEIIFYSFILVATSNAVNLSDGLDGLAAGLLIFAFLSLLAFAYQWQWNQVVLLITVILGTLIAFLWYNIYPAQIFMGDLGSLPLGALLGLLVILLKKELLMIVIGIVFIMETLSVIVQMMGYKFLKKRIFSITPIHHHFEKKGYHEVKIVVRFWIFALLAMVISFLDL